MVHTTIIFTFETAEQDMDRFKDNFSDSCILDCLMRPDYIKNETFENSFILILWILFYFIMTMIWSEIQNDRKFS